MGIVLAIVQTVLLVLWYAVPEMAAVPWGILFIPTWMFLFLITAVVLKEL